MSKRDQGFNGILIVLMVGAIGCFLIVWPLHHFLEKLTQQIHDGNNWLLPVVAGLSYMLGFFVTRLVQDGFDAIFSKAPFSEIGQEVAPGKEKKHPRWVDGMLNPLGYLLFLLRIALTVAVVAGVVWLVIRLSMGPANPPNPPPP
jgi:beta-lactamase regulating signal transducer with metallopeptidase domain